jgi:hypothetical protein
VVHHEEAFPASEVLDAVDVVVARMATYQPVSMLRCHPALVRLAVVFPCRLFHVACLVEIEEAEVAATLVFTSKEKVEVQGVDAAEAIWTPRPEALCLVDREGINDRRGIMLVVMERESEVVVVLNDTWVGGNRKVALQQCIKE